MPTTRRTRDHQDRVRERLETLRALGRAAPLPTDQPPATVAPPRPGAPQRSFDEIAGWVPDPGGTTDPATTRRGRRAAERADAEQQGIAARLLAGRWTIGATAVLGVALIAAVTLGVLGVRWASAEAGTALPVPERPVPTATDVPAPDAAPALSGAPRPDAGGAAADPAPPAPGTPITVHVVGAVGTPGVVEVPGGSRAGTAVTAAGGAAPDADLTRVNLARPLQDGEQVVVPRPGDPDPAPVPVAAGEPGDPAAPSEEGGGLVDLNAASLAELETLPGVGPVLAERIVAWRDANGGFTAVDDLTEVSGIGDKRFAELAPLVTV